MGASMRHRVAPSSVKGREAGYWLGATLFDQVTPAMKIYREEIFRPVLSCVRVKDFADAVKLINSHEHVNGVACYTSDGHIAREFAHRIDVGVRSRSCSDGRRTPPKAQSS